MRIDYKKLAESIIEELDKSVKEHKIHEHTLYYWIQEATEELAIILEKLLSKSKEKK